MTDILFFIVFGWILSLIQMDEMVLDVLNGVFDREFPIVAYYIVFAFLGFVSRMFWEFQKFVTKE